MEGQTFKKKNRLKFLRYVADKENKPFIIIVYSMLEKGLIVSFGIAQIIAREKKAHKEAESIIPPLAYKNDGPNYSRTPQHYL